MSLLAHSHSSFGPHAVLHAVRQVAMLAVLHRMTARQALSLGLATEDAFPAHVIVGVLAVHSLSPVECGLTTNTPQTYEGSTPVLVEPR